MMFTFSRKTCLAVACLSLQGSAVLAELSKPIMSPEVPFSSMDAILYQHLQPTASWYEQWGWGWLPSRCKAVAELKGLNPYDIEVYSVHYADCDQAWVMCRHHDAQVTLDQMIDNFGRLPVRLRNVIRHQISVPTPGDAVAAYTYPDFGDVIYSGPMGGLLRFWIHEAGHAADYNINNPPTGRHSQSQAWATEYDKDQFICDGYAKTNEIENFAQEVVVALFDTVVPGGIGSIVPNWSDIYNQYAGVRAALGDMLVPGGTCNRRFADDTIVCMGPAAGCASKRDNEDRAEDDSVDTWALEPLLCSLKG